MKTLLRIDASMRLNGSRTRELSQHFEQRWRQANPDGQVIRRCLVKQPVPHLDQSNFEQFAQGNTGSSLSDELINELKRADHLLLASPLYNLSLSSGLKAYLDHVVRASQTFQLDNGDYFGLLKNTEATILTASGDADSPDFQSRYLVEILQFIGIAHVNVVNASQESNVECKLGLAKRTIDALIEGAESPEWLGVFGYQDKDAITKLRLAQADAIERGCATSYANLCVNDIQLMIPAHGPVCGKAAFLQAEQNLFAQTRFKRFIKFPKKVERSGDLAVETGIQRVELDASEHEVRDGVRAAEQKYTHVYRKTADGWRYCVLMSNAME